MQGFLGHMPMDLAEQGGFQGNETMLLYGLNTSDQVSEARSILDRLLSVALHSM